MSFFIEDDQMGKYNTICDKASNSIKKEIDIKPVKSEKYLERKKILKKSYEGRINTILHNYKMSKEVFHCFCLSVFRSTHS